MLWKQSHCCRGISRLNFSVGSYLGIKSFENDIVVLSFVFIFSGRSAFTTKRWGTREWWLSCDLERI